MSVQSTGRHALPHTGHRWHIPGLLARILHRTPIFAAAPSGCVPGVEPVGPLPAGSMRQRPGGVYDQVLLDPSRPIGTALDAYRPGLDVVTTDDAEGMPAGMLGRVSLVAVWRTDRPIGVRMQAEGWSPLVWFNPGEVVSPIAAALALADTLVMDAFETADTLTMHAVLDTIDVLAGGAR